MSDQASASRSRVFPLCRKWLFYSGIVLSLVPVWISPYFLTGDGPCHLYNAQVLLDFLTEKDDTFYSEFYTLNAHADPNWFSHVALATLLFFLPGWLAEKIFLTAYVILYAFALRWLLKRIRYENAFLAIAGLPFMYVYSFQMGFYNYAWSIVLFFICIGVVLNILVHRKQFLLLTLLVTCMYFMHPIGWILTVVLTTGILLFHSLTAKSFVQSKWKKYGGILLAFLPSVLLMIDYMLRKGTHISENPDGIAELFIHLIELRSLITMSYLEVVWALWVSILYGLVFLYILWQRIKLKKFLFSDVYLMFFVITLCIYFFQPGGMAGAGILSIRLQFLPFLAALLWYANFDFRPWMKWVVMCAAWILGALLIITRLPYHINASHGAEEIVSVKDRINDYSVLLPLSYSHSGKNPNGTLISNRIWLLGHAANYLGVGRHLIILDNYEGNTGYFPIVWRPEVNPYKFLSKGEGIEGQPPEVDIPYYESIAQVKIDYVLAWCPEGEYSNHPATQRVNAQLEQGFLLSYESPDKRVRLYERK